MALTRRDFFRNLGVLASVLSVGLTVTMPQRKLKAVRPMVGYKGSAFFEAGVVYAPYIPLYQTSDIVIGSMPSRFVSRFANLPLTKGKNLLQLG